MIDGDTLDVEIDLGWSMRPKERVRLKRVGTPELKRKEERDAAIWVKEEVEKLLKPGAPQVITFMAYDRTGQVRGKFGRTMVVVYRAEDGLCINRYLIEQKITWITRTGLKSSFVARAARCEAKQGRRAKKPQVYPLRYIEDFFAKTDEVAARIALPVAEDTFETCSNKRGKLLQDRDISLLVGMRAKRERLLTINPASFIFEKISEAGFIRV